MNTKAAASDPVDRVLARVQNVRARGEGHWAGACPVCGDTKAHLDIRLGRNGTILLTCHRCRAAFVSIVAALGLRATDFFADDGRRVPAGNHPPGYASGSGCRPIAPPRPAATPAEPILPVPDREYMERFITWAHRSLMERDHLRETWLRHRGLSAEACREYRVGFAEKAFLEPWRRPVCNAWVIPIAGCAVKLHFEHPPEGHPKLLWAPFGTVPDPGETKPRHGFATLWPWPQPPYEREERAAIAEYDAADCFPSRAAAEAFADRTTPGDGTWLHLCPGELKALAVLSAGLPAAAITGGESHRWTPALLAPFRGRRVCLVYDEDDAGRKFRDATVCALRGVAASVRAITFGRNAQ